LFVSIFRKLKSCSWLSWSSTGMLMRRTSYTVCVFESCEMRWLCCCVGARDGAGIGLTFELLLACSNFYSNSCSWGLLLYLSARFTRVRTVTVSNSSRTILISLFWLIFSTLPNLTFFLKSTNRSCCCADDSLV